MNMIIRFIVGENMSSKVLIIAEAGVNHNGDMNLAEELIDVAASSGADIVKFQSFKSINIVTADAPKAIYQKVLTNENESQIEMLKKLEIGEKDYARLIDRCNKNKIKFLSTPFDVESLKFLLSLNIDLIKIPSGEITNYPLLREIGKSNKDVIMSTGMTTIDDIKSALDVLSSFRTSDIAKVSLLHCTTEYPAPFSDINLYAIRTLAQEFQLPVGYSDHSEGIEVPIAAVALGARIIEKHFTLDKTLPGPDHKASLNPDELKKMINAIRNIEISLGDGKKNIMNSERKNMLIARKSIVASKDISQGEKFSEDNITSKRPGIGISPMRWNEVLSLKAKRNFRKDELIEL